MAGEIEALIAQHRSEAIQRIRVGLAGLCLVAVSTWATIQNASHGQEMHAEHAPSARPSPASPTNTKPDTPIVIEPAPPASDARRDDSDNGSDTTVTVRTRDRVLAPAPARTTDAPTPKSTTPAPDSDNDVAGTVANMTNQVNDTVDELMPSNAADDKGLVGNLLDR